MARIGRPGKPIARGDGQRYASAMDAARALAAEQGTGTVQHMAQNIANSASGRPHCNTAYGYRWEWI